MATAEPRTKAMLAIRRNMRKKAAGQYSKMSAADRRQAVILASKLASAPNGRARKVPKPSNKSNNITPDTVLNKKPNDPRTLSMIKTESSRKRDTEKAALRKSLASTGRTGPKKESTQPVTVPKKSLTQSEINKIIKTPRTALEIKKFLEGKVVRTGDRILMDAWKYVESRINQKNAQTGENTISKSRREAAAKEEARQAASADETKREGVREKRTTRIQISDARRTQENNSSRPVAHPEGEKGRSRSAQETADADYKKTGGQDTLIKPAEDSVRGKLNKKIADAKKAAMRYYNDAVRAKALKEGEISIAQERAIFRAKVKATAAAKATETEREAARASGSGQDSRSASMRRTRARIANTGVGQNVRGTGVGIGGGTLKEMR